MHRIIAIAADYQHVLNFCKEKDMLPTKFVHATDTKKMQGLHDYDFVWISDPYDDKFRYEVQIELRKARANRLPLDINEWPLTTFL